MNALSIVKSTVGAVVGFGVGKIISTIVVNNVPAETAIDKTTVFAARLVIAMLVGDATQKYTDAKIDSIADALNKAKAAHKDPELV